MDEEIQQLHDEYAFLQTHQNWLKGELKKSYERQQEIRRILENN